MGLLPGAAGVPSASRRLAGPSSRVAPLRATRMLAGGMRMRRPSGPGNPAFAYRRDESPFPWGIGIDRILSQIVPRPAAVFDRDVGAPVGSRPGRRTSRVRAVRRRWRFVPADRRGPWKLCEEGERWGRGGRSAWASGKRGLARVDRADLTGLARSRFGSPGVGEPDRAVLPGSCRPGDPGSTNGHDRVISVVRMREPPGGSSPLRSDPGARCDPVRDRDATQSPAPAGNRPRNSPFRRGNDPTRNPRSKGTKSRF